MNCKISARQNSFLLVQASNLIIERFCFKAFVFDSLKVERRIADLKSSCLSPYLPASQKLSDPVYNIFMRESGKIGNGGQSS